MTKALLALALATVGSGDVKQAAPMLTFASPPSIARGGTEFTLTVNGSGFTIDSVLLWNGDQRPTTFVSGGQLRANIGASDIAAPGLARLTVVNGSPKGGESNVLNFPIFIRQTTNDLIYAPDPGLIFASVPGIAGGNGIISIDPNTGETSELVFVGSESAKLSLSDDGRSLYVVLDGAAAVRRFDIATRTAGLQFWLGADDVDGPMFVENIHVLPGYPGSVAVLRYQANYRYAGVAVYDEGVRRPVQVPNFPIMSVMQTSPSGEMLYGYNGNVSDFTFYRMRVDGSGVTLVDSTQNLISGYGVDMRVDFADGLVYATSGRVIDPVALTIVGTFPGISFPALVKPDSASGRAFFLLGRDLDPTRTLAVFDPTTFTLIGSTQLPGVSGNATSLIQFGDKVAFRTVDDQVFITPSAVGSGIATSQADCRPRSVGATRPLAFYQNAELDGMGPPTLSSLSPAGIARGGMEFILTVYGSGFTTDSILRWNGGDRSTTFVTSYQLMASILDSDIATPGLARLTVFNPGQGESNALNFSIFLRQATNDLIYEPVTGLIFASVPSSDANGIVSIAPATGEVSKPVFVGNEPKKLALSDDGQSLFVALGGEAAVRQFDVPTGTAGIRFTLGDDPFYGPSYAEDLQVLPGYPNSVAVSLMSRGLDPRHRGVAIFDNGVSRPIQTPGHIGSNLLQYSNSTETLYGLFIEGSPDAFFRMHVNGSGVTITDSMRYLLGSSDMRFDKSDGRIYGDSGRVIDPIQRRLLGTFRLSVFNPRVIKPDSVRGRVFVLVGDQFQPTRTLYVFDANRFTPLGSAQISGVTGYVTSLIQWSDDALAFRTSGNQVFIVPSPVPAGSHKQASPPATVH